MPRRVDPVRRQLLAWCLNLCGLVSCTSFADPGDTPITQTEGEPTLSSGGAAGAQSVAPSEEQVPRPLPGFPSTAPPAGQPGGMGGARGDGSGGSTLDGTPGPTLDAGPLPPPVAEADAAVPTPPDDPPVQVPPCFDGLALGLDGATFASVERVVETDFTLEAWVKTSESLPGVSGFLGRSIFDSDVIGMALQNDFGVSVLGGRLAFAVGNPDVTVQGVQSVSTGEWVHVAVTRRASNGQMQLLVNGALEAAGVSGNRGALSARPGLAIGGFSMARKFIGAIDEVRFWNVVRSTAEISVNMRVRLSGSEEGLVGYYPFEDQGVTQTADLSALGLTATLTGNPAYVPSSALCTPARAQ